MLGADRFIYNKANYSRLRLGLLTNHATLTTSGKPLAVALLEQGIRIEKLFSPEHGVFSQAEDGAGQKNQIDNLTGLPVVSLYGKKLAPDEEDFESIDTVLVDLPNIGCRFYTYWWTITHTLEACARYHKKIIILDRPNLRGFKSLTEGPLLDEKNCSSFIGRWEMPLSYHYTYGELARWFVHQRAMSVSLEVLPNLLNTPLHFVPPSPAINEMQAVLAYPCTGIFEGINVSIGRGTTFPFRVIGAPWISSRKFLTYLQQCSLDGLQAYPYSFKPMWSMYAQEFCHGVYISISDAQVFSPVSTAIQIMQFLMNEYPGKIKQADYPTAANPTGAQHLDKLLGVQDSFQKINSGTFAELIPKGVSAWTDSVDQFLNSTK